MNKIYGKTNTREREYSRINENIRLSVPHFKDRRDAIFRGWSDWEKEIFEVSRHSLETSKHVNAKLVMARRIIFSRQVRLSLWKICQDLLDGIRHWGHCAVSFGKSLFRLIVVEISSSPAAMEKKERCERARCPIHKEQSARIRLFFLPPPPFFSPYSAVPDTQC